MVLPTEIERAAGQLRIADRIAVVSHERPDGDAVGSLLGLALALRRRGKQAHAILAGGLPGRFAFLPGAESVETSIPSGIDLLITVDCAELERTALPADSLRSATGLNIDHHPTNAGYAHVNLIDPEAAATSEILFRLSGRLGLPVDREVALNYLAGLVTDTIGFRTPNVSPAVLRVAADLEERCGGLAQVSERLLHRRPFAAARYWGAGLTRLERSGSLVWTRLTLEDRLAAGYSASDDADLVNLLSTIEEGEVFLVFIEQSGGQVKVSWRSNTGLDVSRVAQGFGGGGHQPAAGASIPGSMDQVVRQVIDATRAAMTTAGGAG